MGSECDTEKISSYDSKVKNFQIDKIKYHLASKIEGQKLLSEKVNYYHKMNQADIEWRLKKKGATLEELMVFSQKCVLEFTQKEQEQIEESIKYIEDSIKSYGFKLPFPKEDIIFIKTSMLEEGGASGYTHQTEIYLGESDFPKLTPLMSEETKREEISKFYALISHEIFHCLTRNSPEFRRSMYKLIGFNILDNEINFPPEMRDKIVNNPDVERFDNYAEFNINGVKCKCALMLIYTKTWREVEAEGKKDAFFFQYILPVLIPIDELDTYLPCDMASDFIEKVGDNTPYVIAPEEILADNFKEIIIKSNIDNFPNPELLKNMITIMKECKF